MFTAAPEIVNPYQSISNDSPAEEYIYECCQAQTISDVGADCISMVPPHFTIHYKLVVLYMWKAVVVLLRKE